MTVMESYGDLQFPEFGFKGSIRGLLILLFAKYKLRFHLFFW